MAYQVQHTSTPATAGTGPSGDAPGEGAPGGNAPTILSPPSASAASASIRHIVALEEGNREHFDNNTSKFSRMRVTIHTTGAWENSVHSNNHVTILLILDEEEASSDGSLVNYHHSNTEIKYFDYDLDAPVQVQTLYRAIRNDWHFHRYLFSAGGSGCHYWKYVHAY
ncbi:hypothetical protein BDY21DRAFT_367270 [Lineolata rhizophorae]|uniref:DUF7770 domain-containing protein n=1 Tax=Lineolata rhizophorae TaxID=578093 RepID=A0A6A6NNZ4_9PEZI|nr:hypothetical protein BDY21DRAFT_367270 [Lineolata rhizophorae]